MYLTHKTDGTFDDHPTVIKQEEDSISITYTYHMPTTPRADCELTYQVFGDGTIKTKLAYVPVKELGDMPEFGVMFQINADYDQVEWYGLGPEETYADRTQGAKLGIYRNEVKDNLAKDPSELWIDIFPFDNVPDRGTRSYCQCVRLMQKLYQKNLEANGFYALEATRKKGIYNYLNKIVVWIAGKFNKEKLVER